MDTRLPAEGSEIWLCLPDLGQAAELVWASVSSLCPLQGPQAEADSTVCGKAGHQSLLVPHPVADPPSLHPADQQNFTVTLDQVLTRCLEHQRHWSHLAEDRAGPDLWSPLQAGGPASLLLVPHPPHPSSTSSLVFSCVSHALQWISQGRDPVFQPASPPRGLLTHPTASNGASVLREAGAIHVLVTGSLHLVGSVLKLLEPSLSQ